MTRSIIGMAALVAAILLPYTLNAQEITICPYKDGKSCAVSFTFDDGFQDNYTIAAPELEKRGWKGPNPADKGRHHIL